MHCSQKYIYIKKNLKKGTQKAEGDSERHTDAENLQVM